MDVGYYLDLSFDAYCTIDAELPAARKAVNYHSLRHMQQYPAMVLAALRGKFTRDTDDLKFGRDLHSFLLTHDEFMSSYLVAGECCGVLKSGKRKGEECGKQGRYLTPDNRWHCAMHEADGDSEPPNWIKAETLDTFQSIGQVLHQHPAKEWLPDEGVLREMTIVAELFGLRCKGRLDHYDPTRNMIVDLKKCKPGKTAIDSIEHAVKSYSYHCQLGFYQMLVAEAFGVPLPECLLFFIEDDWPIGINARRINSRLLAIGRFECRRWLQRFRRCQADGEWPDAYSESLRFDAGGYVDSEPLEPAPPHNFVCGESAIATRLKSITGSSWYHEQYDDHDLESVGGWDESERPLMAMQLDTELEVSHV